VPNCLSIHLAGAINEQAYLIATHPSQDLAILQTASRRAPHIAPMRVNLRSLRVGDSLNIAGFPGRSGFDGKLMYVSTSLLSMNGPMGEPNFLEFQNAAQKGNSGGPLMDASGNVIGVVTGKAQVIQRGTGVHAGKSRVVRESDVAITLPYLKPFLSKYGVRFDIAGGGMRYNPKTVAEKARNSIVHVRCRVSG
jgi:S1-C subfamily serine protease